MERTKETRQILDLIWSHPESWATGHVIYVALKRASKEQGLSILQARDSVQASDIAKRAIEILKEEASRLQKVIEVLQQDPMGVYYTLGGGRGSHEK